MNRPFTFIILVLIPLILVSCANKDEPFPITGPKANATATDSNLQEQGPEIVPNPTSGCLAVPFVSLNKTVFSPGEIIKITYMGFCSSLDWVATAIPLSSNTSYINYKYFSVPSSGVLDLIAPTPVGTYELRFFSDNTYDEMRPRISINVQ